MAQDIVPTKPKEIAKVIVLGTGVVYGTALLSPLVSKLPVVGTITVPVINLTLAAMLAAGLAASLVQYAIIKLWK